MQQEAYFKTITKKALKQGKLPESEEQELKAWINANPGNSKKFQEWNIQWGLLETMKELDEDVVDLKWQGLKPFLSGEAKSNKHRSLRPWLKYAAVFILGILLSGAGIALIQNKQQSVLAEMQRVDVPAGSSSTIHLADGTTIHLNAGSKLAYSSHFTFNNREVILDGEAYFEIAKHRRKPFVVNTSNIIVKAYGTEFNVRAYETDPTIETTLVEGCVSVERISEKTEEEKIYYLKPNEQALYIKESGNKTGNKSGIVISKDVKTHNITSWMNGEMHLRSETLSSLIIKLQRRYDVIIHITDSTINDFKFTGNIKNETIEQVLNVIQLTSPITYKIENREIWLDRD